VVGLPIGGHDLSLIVRLLCHIDTDALISFSATAYDVA
jgi:hypothetical protein